MSERVELPPVPPADPSWVESVHDPLFPIATKEGEDRG